MSCLWIQQEKQLMLKIFSAFFLYQLKKETTRLVLRVRQLTFYCYLTHHIIKQLVINVTQVG